MNDDKLIDALQRSRQEIADIPKFFLQEIISIVEKQTAERCLEIAKNTAGAKTQIIRAIRDEFKLQSKCYHGKELTDYCKPCGRVHGGS